MFVWNEEDVIEATVKNAFAHGVDKVFLIDNGSTDKTVLLAVRAGATHIHSVDTGYFDGKLKYGTVNAVIRQINKNENDSSIWWLILDADEFPDTRLGIGLRAFLEALDSDVTVAAAELLDHLPTHPPYNIPGYHPIHFQTAASRISMHKLPLLRYDADKPHIMTMAGAHTYHTADGSCLTGTAHKLLFHHFNYRKLETSLGRLKQLTDERTDGTRHIDERDAYAIRLGGSRTVYWERMEKMEELFRASRNRHILDFSPENRTPQIPLWYSPEDIPAGFTPRLRNFCSGKPGICSTPGTTLKRRAYSRCTPQRWPGRKRRQPAAAQLCLELDEGSSC